MNQYTALQALIHDISENDLSYEDVHVYAETLSQLLKAVYAVKHEFEWRHKVSGDVPHFTDFGLLKLAVEDARPLTRAFLAMEALKPEFTVLDIGCGDGCFANRFLAPSCATLDGIDILPASIAASSADKAPNATFFQCDAVHDPFPRAQYDCIVFDGAIGHFSCGDTEALLQKILAHLTPDGLFVGSESLGREGADHLQFFMQPQDLSSLLSTAFPVVTYKVLEYPICNGSIIRREIYWRCARTRKALQHCVWKQELS